MASHSAPDPKIQQGLLKIIKSLTRMPAKKLYYGLALLAIAATGGVAMPDALGMLATTAGMNVLINILERIKGGDDIREEEIRKIVEDAISTSGIENLTISNEIHREIAHLFRQFDLVKYAIQQGENAVLSMLSEKSVHIEEILQEIKSGMSLNLDQGAKTLDIVKRIEETQKISLESSQLFSFQHFPRTLIDQKIEDEIAIIRKSRFFVEFDRIGYSLAFAKRLLEGDFFCGTDSVKSRALAWCVRLLSHTEETNKAEEYLMYARELGNNSEIEIAQAFIYSQKGDKNAALSTLAGIETPTSRSAAFMVISNHDGPQKAIDWLKTTNIAMTELDPDGKYFLLMHQLQLAHWEAAQECLITLTDQDLDEAPILHHVMAITRLTSVVPNELRTLVLNQLPFEAATFPLASYAAAIETRREAYHDFVEAVRVEQGLALPYAATVDDDYALWLELKDPNEFEKGKQRLKDKLRDPKSALRLVHLGLQFGIALDLDLVEREIERQIAIHGEITKDAAIARFAFAFTQKTPLDVANYIEQHQAQLAKYIDKNMLLSLQIDMLSKAGLPGRAHKYLINLLEEGISKEEENRLRRIIAEAEGADPVEMKKEQFKTTGSLGDLAALVNELETRGELDDLCVYGQILFDRTHSLRYAILLANALFKTQKTEQLVEFIESHRDLLAQSKDLQMLFCWALYYEGTLLDARYELAKLSDFRDNLSYRQLQINLGIAIGDWNSLISIVANECLEKNNRSAQDLINTAQLALILNSPHTKELILAAADKGKDDANILVNAYFLASSIGWDDDPDVSKWINEAAKLSGDNGPIQKMTVKAVLDLKPDWDRRESETWQMLSRGDIPIFLAAHSLNKSLINLMLFPALANVSEKDPRRRGIIPAYSGSRQPKPLDTHGTVGIDATALLTLSFLNLLDKTFDAFGTVYLSHSTLGWLFEEKHRATFHQPSRIADAHRVRDMLATNILEKLIPRTVPDSDLSTQVGDDLALLIAEAEKPWDDNIQRIVVRPSPVHRIASLMEEEADLTQHSAVLSSCQSLVDKLQQNGHITAEEAKKASAYLLLQEKPWPHQPEILDGAILYLDDLATYYFLHTGILDKLQPAGFRPIVSLREIDEINELISYETISEHIKDNIERIRYAINSRIESGKIKVGRIRNINVQQEQTIFWHPTAAIFDLVRNCSAVIIDDRMLNQNANLSDGSSQVPIFTTLDLIDALASAGYITTEEQLEYRTSLRRAGYFFVPVSSDELTRHLHASIIQDNMVIDKAELKAIRENILRIRMSTWLQFPKEVPWLDMMLRAFILALKDLWESNVDLSRVRPCSDWILNQLDFRGWAHCLGIENGYNFVNIGRGAYILLLLTPPLNASMDIRKEYWDWVENRVLAPIKEQYPDLYSWIIEWQRRKIAELADMDLTEGEQHDE